MSAATDTPLPTAAPLPVQGRDIELTLSGLSCASCVGRAERALAAVPGIEAPQVNLATGRARMRLLDPGALPRATEALERAGYPALEEHTTLNVEGMSCASCVGRVERALTETPGVSKAETSQFSIAAM